MSVIALSASRHAPATATQTARPADGAAEQKIAGRNDVNGVMLILRQAQVDGAGFFDVSGGRNRKGRRFRRPSPLSWERLSTTPGGVCHACTSRPRPI